MRFHLEKRPEKRQWTHHTPCQPIISVDGLCYKMGYSIHRFYKKIFSCLKMFIMQQRKNRAEMR